MVTASRASPSHMGARWRASSPYLYLLPAFLLILILDLYPTFEGIRLSFTDSSLVNPGATSYVGFQNYLTLFTTTAFWTALWHSILLTVVAVGLELIFGIVLSQRVPGIRFLRSIALLSWVLPIIVSVLTFQWMLQPDYGLFNILLKDLGINGANRYWFGDIHFAFIFIVIMHLWRNIPFFGVSFMASLQAIPAEFYEAAQIDGASGWARLRHITLPQLRHIGMVLIVLHTVFTFNDFNFVYLATGGGPVNSTLVLPVYVYNQAWQTYQLGYASAAGVIMLILLIAMTFVYLRVIGEPES